MRRSIHPPSSRRHGQALLLAVLIMIFAALLSAAFIGIVAVNLNQTARQGDKNLALDNAKAGLNYVNQQLTYSAKGDRWRPQDINNPPVNGDITYPFYYSNFDQAQGWTDNYVKFPDPRADPTDGPQFLAKVERVPFNTPSTSADYDKIGALKITVIGLSPDDPTAFSRMVAYKGGYRHAPLGQVMRSVSNWDFTTGSSISAHYSGGTNNGTTGGGPTYALDVLDATGDFNKVATPFSITLSDPARGVDATNAVVVSLTGTYPTYTFNLSKALVTAPTTTTRVDLAANLGGADGVDDDNDTTTVPRNFFTNLFFSDTDGGTYTANEVDSARVNLGLVWTGAISAPRLRSPLQSYNGTNTITGVPGGIPLIPATIEASSVLVPDTASASTVPTPLPVKAVAATNPDNLIGSRSVGLFNGAPVNASFDPQEFIQDGWARIMGSPTNTSTLRSVPDFKPPVIDSGAAVARYRDMARNSAPTSTTYAANAALYGYGKNIYLDNVKDIETIGLGAGKFRPMTQTELTQMWLSKPSTGLGVINDYLRIGAPAAAGPDVSLEQSHQRGWVGTDEFRARGVEIEIVDNGTNVPPVLVVTRDAREDGANNSGGALDKAWVDPTSGNASVGKYTQILPWPVDGLIFAEGNVRIKGRGSYAPTSLTVVSMGNIYIEDSLSLDNDANTATDSTRKILLAAKKNVVMNPTRVLGRPDAQTRVDGPQSFVTGTPIDLKVFDTAAFHKGDLVQANFARGFVTTEPAPGDTILKVTPVTDGNILDQQLLTTPNVTPTQLNSGSTLKTVMTEQVLSPAEILQRRLSLPAGTTLADMRIAFNHQAERVPAFSVATTNFQTHSIFTSPIYFTNKGVFITPPPTTAPYLDHTKHVSSQAQQFMQVDYPGPVAPGVDKFPGTSFSAPPPTTKAEADALTLATISTIMNGIDHSDPDPSGPGWKYDTSVIGGYGAAPIYTLAGVGNRLDYGAVKAVAPALDDRRQPINPSASPGPAGGNYQVPLATTIGLTMNGAATPVYNENWNTTLTTPNYDSTNQFGFRTFTDPAPTDPNEDILTSDQSFYNSDAGKSTIDSRSFTDVVGTNTGIALGDNTLVLRQPNGLPAVTYPAYRMMGTKLEDVTLKASSGTVIDIAPAHTFTVNAYVYAQTGSWFVIPTPAFDEQLRGDTVRNYLDINNDNTPNPGEYLDADASGNYSNGDYADLNRNGIVDSFEQFATLRYLRYNYQINFTGSISENQTPLVSDSGQARGAVSDWMDKTATVTYAPATTTPITYNRIKYVFDPSLAQGSLDNEPGFLVPQTSELFNVS